jgi:hypothetical protein
MRARTRRTCLLMLMVPEHGRRRPDDVVRRGR